MIFLTSLRSSTNSTIKSYIFFLYYIKSHLDTGMKNSLIRTTIDAMRLDQPAGFWLLLWPTWGALFYPGSASVCLDTLLIFAVGVWSTRTAGCLINDWCDRDIDAQVARTCQRPLADGRMSRAHFIWCLGLCLALAAWVAWCLGPIIWPLVPLSLVSMCVYPLAKRVFVWPQLVLSLTFAQGVLYAFLVKDGALYPHAWLFYAAVCCWIFAFDSVYALNDITDDLKLGLHSSAIAMGSYAKPFITVLYMVFFVTMSVLYYLPHQLLKWALLTAGLGFWAYIVIKLLYAQEYWQGFIAHAWCGAFFWLISALLYH